jgi:flagellar basal-body rod protein FlgG
MVRSLYSAASGMIAQQTNVDVISNNLANVNSTGYKSESATFKSLLYQDLQAKTTTANGDAKPVSAQVGLGSRVAAVTSHYTEGSANATDSNTDFMINGDGFFAVQDISGETLYTRNGSFVFAIAQDGFMLSTAEGYPVLSSDGSPIVLSGDEYNAAEISVDGDGNLCYPDEQNNPQPIGISIAVFQFTNPSGLEKVGSSYLRESDASGIPLNEADGDVGTKSTIKQGYLEASNVNVATEMVNLITAQRAYELCSKAITTSDTMMEQANNLKR